MRRLLMAIVIISVLVPAGPVSSASQSDIFALNGTIRDALPIDLPAPMTSEAVGEACLASSGGTLSPYETYDGPRVTIRDANNSVISTGLTSIKLTSVFSESESYCGWSFLLVGGQATGFYQFYVDDRLFLVIDQYELDAMSEKDQAIEGAPPSLVLIDPAFPDFGSWRSQ